MKAVTLWQPWASLVAAGLKPYEFRAWPAPRALVGQRIAIHAGARPAKRSEMAELLLQLARATSGATPGLLDRRGSLDLLERAVSAPRSLPHSAIVCTAILGEPIPPQRVAAMANDSDRSGHFNWAWPLTDIHPCEPPEPAVGAQGFWDWRGQQTTPYVLTR